MKTRNPLYLSCVFVALHFVFFASQISTAHASEHVLVVGTPKSFPPQYDIDVSGQPTGLAIDIFESLVASTNFTVEYKIYDNWAAIQQALLDGSIDIIPDLGISEARQKWASFSIPSETFQISLFVRAGNDNIVSLNDFKQRVLGVVDFNIGQKIAEKYGQLKLKKYHDPVEAFHGLISGQVDGVVYPQPNFMKIAWDSQLEHRIQLAGPPLKEVKRALAVKRGEERLLEIFNPLIRTFVATPQYKQIYTRWYGKPAPYWDEKKILFTSVICFIALFIGMTFWRNLSLRKLNQKLADEVRHQTKDLEEREYKYRTLLNHQHDAVFLHPVLETGYGRFIEVNNIAVERYGYSYEEFLHLSAVDLTIAADVENHLVSDARKQLLSRGNAVFDLTHVKKNGETFPVEVSASVVVIEGTEFLLSIVRDISERKIAEEKLVENEKKYRSLYDNAPLSYQALNASGCLIDVNLTWLKTLGYTRDEVIGSSFKEFLHPDWTDQFETNFTAFKDKGFAHNVQLRLKRKSGSFLDVLFEGRASLNSDGHFEQSYCVFTDITEKKVAEEALRQSEQKFRVLADYTLDCESWRSPKGDYIYLSPSCENVTGYPPKSFLDNPELLFDLVHDEYREQVVYHYKDENNSDTPSCIKEFPITSRSGETRWIEHRCWAIFDEEGEYIGRRSNNRDISDRKRNEAKKQELEVQLRQKTKMEAVGNLAGGMAHNFNNNLSIVLGNLDLISLQGRHSDEISKLIDNAKIGVQRSKELIQKIMSYSRSGSMDYGLVNLLTVVQESCVLIQSTLPSSVEIECQLSDENTSAMTIANESSVQEAIFNLCSNSVHAMNEVGRLKLSMHHTVLHAGDIPALYETCEPGEFTVISVSDNGCGISEDVLGKVFDPFFTTKDVDEGTGMGLSTVQGMIKEIGGMISAESRIGHGSTFNLYFPMPTNAVLEPSEERIVETIEKNVRREDVNTTVLVVDDEINVVSICAMMFKSAGYNVIEKTNSLEAFDYFRQNSESIDLILTDQTMPGLTGIDLIKKVKQIKPDILTIISTGFSSKIDSDDIEKHNIDGFISKPFERAELLRVVEKTMAQNNTLLA